MDALRWLRVIGDTIFAAGALAFGWFVLGLKTGWSVAAAETDLQGRGQPTGEVTTSPAGA